VATFGAGRALLHSHSLEDASKLGQISGSYAALGMLRDAAPG
jgi:hypothetical protein